MARIYCSMTSAGTSSVACKKYFFTIFFLLRLPGTAVDGGPLFVTSPVYLVVLTPTLNELLTSIAAPMTGLVLSAMTALATPVL